MNNIIKQWCLSFFLMALLSNSLLAQSERYDVVIGKTDGTELVFEITDEYPIISYYSPNSYSYITGYDEWGNPHYVLDENNYPTMNKEQILVVDYKKELTIIPSSEIKSIITREHVIVCYAINYIIDGEIIHIDSIEVGMPVITSFEVPKKEGYTFAGWNKIPTTMPANDVEVTGSFNVNSYRLKYKVDGKLYMTLLYDYGSNITPAKDLTKEGYTFSGWSEIPTTMPAHDVEVTGSFTVNKYLLTVLVDGEVYYSDSIAYGTRLADYVDIITKQGIDISQWELYDQIDKISMPAHDVVINAVLDAVIPVEIDRDESVIYDIIGRKISAEEISTLPAGIYIRNGRKFIVR